MDGARPASPLSRERPSQRRLLRLAGAAVLATAAVLLFGACGDDKSESAPTPAAGRASFMVNMNDQLRFDPDNLTIPKGATVTWKNVAQVPHTATDDPAKAGNKANAVLPNGAEPWDSGLILGGESWSRTFDISGTYTYFCIPHEAAGMVGRITVQG